MVVKFHCVISALIILRAGVSAFTLSSSRGLQRRQNTQLHDSEEPLIIQSFPKQNSLLQATFERWEDSQSEEHHYDGTEDGLVVPISPKTNINGQEKRQSKPVLVVFDSWSSCVAPSLRGRPNHHSQPIQAFFDRRDLISGDRGEGEVDVPGFSATPSSDKTKRFPKLILPVFDSWESSKAPSMKGRPNHLTHPVPLFQGHQGLHEDNEDDDDKDDDGVEVVKIPATTFTGPMQPPSPGRLVFESRTTPSLRTQRSHYVRPLYTFFDKWDAFSGDLREQLRQNGVGVARFPLGSNGEATIQAKRSPPVFDSWASCVAPSMRGRPNHQSQPLYSFFDQSNSGSENHRAQHGEGSVHLSQHPVATFDAQSARKVTLIRPAFDGWLSCEAPSMRNRQNRRLEPFDPFRGGSDRVSRVGSTPSENRTVTSFYADKLAGKVLWNPGNMPSSRLSNDIEGTESQEQLGDVLQGEEAPLANAGLQKDSNTRDSISKVTNCQELTAASDRVQVMEKEKLVEGAQDTNRSTKEASRFTADFKSKFKPEPTR